MKVMIINGSSRTNGITATALHMIENVLVESGAHVEFIDLCKIQMKHCIGCCSCYKTGFCHIDDDVDKVIQKISNADGIVLVSPTYASNVSGLMKDFWSCSYQSSF